MTTTQENLQVAAKSTTQESLQVVKQLYAQLGQGNMQAVLDLMVDDIIWEVTGPTEVVPWLGKRQGREQVSKYFNQINETVGIISFDLQEMVAQDDKVMALIQEKSYCKATNRTYGSAFAHLFIVSEGKIARFYAVLETAPIVAAFLDRDL